MAIPLEIYNRSFESRRAALANWQIPESEKSGLLRFLDELALGRVNKGRKISETRLTKYLDVLRVPLEFFRKPMVKLTLKDVENFERALSSGAIQSNRGTGYSHASKVDIRRALKIYLRWKLG